MYTNGDVDEAIINKDIITLQLIVDSSDNLINNNRLLELKHFLINIDKYKQAIADLWHDVESF